MKSHLVKTVAAILFVLFGQAKALFADSELEGRFQDAFVTAGYSAAAGAAIGAALLTFQNEPTKHLKFISLGASIGFLGGTVLGSWLSIAPAFAEIGKPNPMKFAEDTKSSKFVLRPWLNHQGNRFVGIEAGAVFALNL